MPWNKGFVRETGASSPNNPVESSSWSPQARDDVRESASASAAVGSTIVASALPFRASGIRMSALFGGAHVTNVMQPRSVHDKRISGSLTRAALTNSRQGKDQACGFLNVGGGSFTILISARKGERSAHGACPSPSSKSLLRKGERKKQDER